MIKIPAPRTTAPGTGLLVLIILALLRFAVKGLFAMTAFYLLHGIVPAIPAFGYLTSVVIAVVLSLLDPQSTEIEIK